MIKLHFWARFLKNFHELNVCIAFYCFILMQLPCNLSVFFSLSKTFSGNFNRKDDFSNTSNMMMTCVYRGASYSDDSGVWSFYTISDLKIAFLKTT